MADKHTLAFEIGVEEIPAFDLDSANKQLEKMVPAAFADARIPYDSIEIHSSPRRLIVMAYGVADATEALVEEYKGPAAKIAFDADGNPTTAEMFIVAPLFGGGMAKLFSTHPDINDRIARLREMAGVR